MKKFLIMFMLVASTASAQVYIDGVDIGRMLVDEDGNKIDSHMSGDGDYHLATDSAIVGFQHSSRHAFISPTNSMNVNSNVRLIGTSFDGMVKDTNFWTEDVYGSGAAVQDGGITLTTGTTANSAATYDTVRSARFVGGSALQFIGAYNFITETTADNVRRCGVYDDDNGIFFQLDGTTFSVGIRRATVDTLISSGSFNGNVGTTFTPTANTYYKLDIEWTPIGVSFYVNNELLHKASGLALRYLTLPIRFENVNANSSISDVSFKCSGTVVMRQGELVTNPISYYHAYAQTTGDTVKFGAGTLRGIIVNNCANNAVITLSDSTTALTPALWVFTAGAQFTIPSSVDMYGLPFSDGLRLTVSAASASVTIVYE